MKLAMHFNLTPTPHQSVRAGNGTFFQPTKIKNFGKAVAVMARKFLPDGFQMIKKDIPLIMRVNYLFEYRKSEKKNLIGTYIPKITKPDLTDNLNKKFIDSLAGIVFEQDQQIFDFHPKKFWFHSDGIYVEFETV